MFLKLLGSVQNVKQAQRFCVEVFLTCLFFVGVLYTMDIGEIF